MSVPVLRVSGTAVVIAGDDIDTDRIVPARFLRCVTFDGLGETLFADERRSTERCHPLDAPTATGARVMISGQNFGCGSSREHAPQAIVRAGFAAVVAEGFAEIFAANSLALGLVCATVDGETAAAISAACVADPSLEVAIDLQALTIRAGATEYPITIPADARAALVAGRWDPLSELLSARHAVERVRGALPYTHWKTA